jgi:hypothetical protein
MAFENSKVDFLATNRSTQAIDGTEFEVSFKPNPKSTNWVREKDTTDLVFVYWEWNKETEEFKCVKVTSIEPKIDEQVYEFNLRSLVAQSFGVRNGCTVINTQRNVLELKEMFYLAISESTHGEFQNGESFLFSTKQQAIDYVRNKIWDFIPNMCCLCNANPDEEYCEQLAQKFETDGKLSFGECFADFYLELSTVIVEH